MVACKGVDRALSFDKTKQYRVRRCSKKCRLRSSPAHLASAPDFNKPPRSKPHRQPNPRDLRQPVRAASRAGAHGFRRALQHGRRLHRIPVRRRTESGRALSAAAPPTSSSLATSSGRCCRPQQSMRQQDEAAIRRNARSIRNSRSNWSTTRQGKRRHHRDRYAQQVPVSGAGRRQGAALRHRRRQTRIHLVGHQEISAKKEWPDWTPPAEMLVRRPDLPRHMEGGPQNPLGARAMYLGSSLYRIHGSNEPGRSAPTYRQAASGCAMRM